MNLRNTKPAVVPTAFLGLGGNLEPRLETLRLALDSLQRGPVRVLDCSSVYETEPVGFAAQPDFLNLTCSVLTQLAPQELLRYCREIEDALGRQPTFKNGPRNIDIDLLTYGDSVFDLPLLKVPHPALNTRRFVLVPLAEIAPDSRDPHTGRSFRQLLSECRDPGRVLWRYPASKVFSDLIRDL